VAELADDKSAWEARQAVKQALSKVYFQIEDYDGEIITASTHIEEREWRFGTGWFSWLSLFSRPKIRKSLDINFSSEVGKEKGSWKGGTLGHGIEMLPNETHEAAFKRYCQQEFRSKFGRYRIEYRGAAPTVEAATV
jgi:peptide methionine sulfoxide reductase MsrB